MKINFVISELYNHFHFVENMSEWSEYTRKSINKDWIRDTGPLTSAEAGALACVKDFFCTYDYGKAVGNYKNIFEFFALAETMADYQAELTRLIGAHDSEVLPSAMAVFADRFDKIWNIQKANFDSKYPVILENLHDEEIESDITRLFGIDEFPDEINAYLVISTNRYASGGANIGKDCITLECSTAVEPNDIMTIFWHEVAHLLQADYAATVYDIVKKSDIRYDFVSEMLAHAVFGTYGALSHKYYLVSYMDRGMARMESYLSTGKIPEEDKHLAHLIPFMAAQYLTAQFVGGMLKEGERITPERMAEAMLDIHKKA